MDKRELFTTAFPPLDDAAARAARVRWDRISKPLDALGDFETLVCRLAAIQGDARPVVKPRAAVVMCGDNGVIAEGVSQCGSEATVAVAAALGRGESSASVLGRAADVRVVPIDVGIASDAPIPGVVSAKIAPGTKNFAVEPAMTEEETLRAIGVGFDAARDLAAQGIRALAAGEMGVGDTTTATAILCATLGLDPDAFVGRGAGLDDAGLARKRRTISAALARYDFSGIADEKERALAILRTFGGFEIAALVGLCVGGAVCRVPVFLDGLVTAVAALIAERIAPEVRERLVATHAGREKGIAVALQKLELTPFVAGNVSFGEGAGAIMSFPILDVALSFFENASTFDDVKLAQYRRFES